MASMWRWRVTIAALAVVLVGSMIVLRAGQAGR
jgi:hypothetical protein